MNSKAIYNEKNLKSEMKKTIDDLDLIMKAKKEDNPLVVKDILQHKYKLETFI